MDSLQNTVPRLSRRRKESLNRRIPYGISTSPVLWFDFSDTGTMTELRDGTGSVSSGTLVGTIKSKSSTHKLVANSDAARPVFVGAQKNGLGTVTFTSAGGSALIQDSSFNYSKYTLVYVTKRDAFASNGRTYASQVPGGTTYGSHRRNTSLNFDSFSNLPAPNLTMYLDSAPWSDYRLVVERFGNSQKRLWSNSVATYSAGGTPPNAIGAKISINCTIGTGGPSNFDNQKMAEFLFYDINLSDSDVSTLSAALMTRWGIV